MIHHLHKIAKNEKIQLRRTYVKEIKGHRNYLKGFIGNEINLLLAATAFLKESDYFATSSLHKNLKKWMNYFLMLIFMRNINMIAYTLTRVSRKERKKYDLLCLMFYRLW